MLAAALSPYKIFYNPTLKMCALGSQAFVGLNRQFGIAGRLLFDHGGSSVAAMIRWGALFLLEADSHRGCQRPSSGDSHSCNRVGRSAEVKGSRRMGLILLQ